MPDPFISADSQSFGTQVLQSELPVLVYFYSDDCPPCMALGPMLQRAGEKYAGHMRFVKIQRQQNRTLADQYHIKSSPTLLFFQGGQEVCSRLTGYISNLEIKSAIENILGGACKAKKRSIVHCDVLILGGGPAGLSAAIYAARAKLYTVIIDEGMPGGQVATTYHISNYPGTNGVIRGLDLVENMKKQALDFGAQLDDLKETLEVRLADEEKYVKTEDTDYYARCVIIATGSVPRKLPAEGEREYRGRGVHYCATCDGALYQDTEVMVEGGGNSAVEEAVFLTRFAKHVTILHRRDHFEASGAAQQEALSHPNISVIWDSEVRKVEGENFVQSVQIENVKTRETKTMNIEGIFVYIGNEPKTKLFQDHLELTPEGYIPTNEDMVTKIPGVFAAGDVREKKIRQIATAVSDGVIAGIMAEKYINGK